MIWEGFLRNDKIDCAFLAWFILCVIQYDILLGPLEYILSRSDVHRNAVEKCNTEDAVKILPQREVLNAYSDVSSFSTK